MIGDTLASSIMLISHVVITSPANCLSVIILMEVVWILIYMYICSNWCGKLGEICISYNAMTWTTGRIYFILILDNMRSFKLKKTRALFHSGRFQLRNKSSKHFKKHLKFLYVSDHRSYTFQ